MNTVFTGPVFEGLELDENGRRDLKCRIDEIEAGLKWCNECLKEARGRLNYCLSIENCRPEKLEEAQKYVAACEKGLEKGKRLLGIYYGELYSQKAYQPAYQWAH